MGGALFCFCLIDLFYVTFIIYIPLGNRRVQALDAKAIRKTGTNWIRNRNLRGLKILDLAMNNIGADAQTRGVIAKVNRRGHKKLFFGTSRNAVRTIDRLIEGVNCREEFMFRYKAV